MRTVRFLVPIVSAYTLALLGATTPALAATIYVNGTTGNDSWSGLCETWDGGTCGPKRSVQAGVDAAADGDSVSLAAGAYSAVTETMCLIEGKSVHLLGPSPSECTMHAETWGVAIQVHGEAASGTTVSGIGFSDSYRGIAAEDASLAANDCVFQTVIGIDSTVGLSPPGGITLTVSESRFEVELAAISTVSLDHIAVSRCTFASGQAFYWPYWPYATVDMTDCEVRGLSQPNVSLVGLSGGGHVRNCLFRENNTSGSVLNVRGGTIDHCVFVLNYAGNSIVVADGPVRDCIIAANFGLSLNSTGVTTNCLVLGGAVSLGAPGRIQNSIIGGAAIQYLDGLPPLDAVSYCCVQGGYYGTGIIAQDPQLVSMYGPDGNLFTIDDNDYHLLPTSPCINRGDPGTVGYQQLDWDGQPRVMGGRVDIGLDEFTDRPFVFGDSNCDGLRDFADIDAFVAALGGEAGFLTLYPDCFVQNSDCNDDGVVDFADIDAFVALLGA